VNTRGTWWLVGTALALLLFILLVERRHQRGGPPPGPQPLFAELVPSQVTRIEIKSAQETLRVERNGLVWRLTAPVSYPAHGRLIDAFLDACTKLTAHTSISAADLASQPRGLADYGLQPPAGVLTIHQGGRTLEFRIGARAPLGESVYAQLGGDDGVKVIEAAQLDLFPRTSAEWRDRSLLSLDGVAFNRLEVRTGARGFEVALDPASRLWQMTRPPPVKRADNPQIELILRELANWQAQAFVTDDPAAPLEPLGLQPPQAELVIGQGTNDLVTVQFGHSPTNFPQLVFARRLSHTNVVLVPTNWLGVLTRHFSSFRDRQLLSFNPTNATQVELRGLFSYSLLRQPAGGWRVGEPFNFPADRELVEGFLTRLQELRIAEFEKDVVTETDLAGYGLASPALRIIVSAATNGPPGVTNTVLADLLLGTNRPPDAVFARRADEPSVYVLPLADANAIALNPFALRDRQLWNFGASNVLAVTAVHHHQTRRYLRETNSNEWRLAGGTGDFLSGAVDEMVHRLGQLRALEWTARGASQLARFGIQPGAGSRVEVELRGTHGVQTLAMDLGRSLGPRGVYASALVDGEPMIFVLPRDLFDALEGFLLPKPAP